MNVRHDVARSLFYVELGDVQATLSYSQPDSRTIDYRSTFVPPHHRMKGIGRVLVCHALDYAKREGLKVIPTCWFVADVMRERT